MELLVKFFWISHVFSKISVEEKAEVEGNKAVGAKKTEKAKAYTDRHTYISSGMMEL